MMKVEDHSGPEVCVIILNWNNPKDTLECINSVNKLDYENINLIVVDNGSTDDSKKIIQNNFQKIALIESQTNLGYAGGNNLALKSELSKKSRYFLILNNDVILAQDAISHLVSAILSETNTGFATPMVLEYDKPDRIFSLGGMIDWKRAETIRLHAGEQVNKQDWRSEDVDFASGSALFFDRRVIDTVGMMDESYFLYFEETDWCIRARKAGISIVTVPDSKVWHKVSATIGQQSPITAYFFTRNEILFIKRNFESWKRIWMISRCLFRGVRTSLAYTILPKNRNKNLHRNAILLGLRDGFLDNSGNLSNEVKMKIG